MSPPSGGTTDRLRCSGKASLADVGEPLAQAAESVRAEPVTGDPERPQAGQVRRADQVVGRFVAQTVEPEIEDFQAPEGRRAGQDLDAVLGDYEADDPLVAEKVFRTER